MFYDDIAYSWSYEYIGKLINPIKKLLKLYFINGDALKLWKLRHFTKRCEHTLCILGHYLLTMITKTYRL